MISCSIFMKYRRVYQYLKECFEFFHKRSGYLRKRDNFFSFTYLHKYINNVINFGNKKANENELNCILLF